MRTRRKAAALPNLMSRWLVCHLGALKFRFEVSCIRAARNALVCCSALEMGIEEWDNIRCIHKIQRPSPRRDRRGGDCQGFGFIFKPAYLLCLGRIRRVNQQVPVYHGWWGVWGCSSGDTFVTNHSRVFRLLLIAAAAAPTRSIAPPPHYPHWGPRQCASRVVG